MDSLFIPVLALLPVMALIIYICWLDRRSPEPPSKLMLAFFAGAISSVVSLFISIPFGLMGLYSEETVCVTDGIRMAFFGAAIPEEVAKLLMLWLAFRKNKYLDERMDGIVYAVCVSLGFAGAENLLYLFSNSDNYMTVGISRTLFAVPGHFCFGVLMGYYYSLVRFSSRSTLKDKALVLLAPIAAHGIYDSILLISEATPLAGGLLLILFLLFFRRMWKIGSRKIREHLEKDTEPTREKHF